jgi:hypothetical protein
MSAVDTMSVAVARRVALAAQGFAEPRPTSTPTRRHLAKVLSRTQVLQLDSVNVAVRAHYMPVFSRLGGYPMSLVDEAAWADSPRRPRMLVEYWAHVASLLPVADWPLLRGRMRRNAADGEVWFAGLREQPTLLADVLSVVKERGPMGAGAVEDELGDGQPKARGGWWNRSDVKRACEYLFATGELTTATRRGFERLYDLTERVLPPQVLARVVDEDDASRLLTEKAAVALGIATEPDLRDYYRTSPERSKRAVAELVAEGTLIPTEVQGWRLPAYRHAAAKLPRRIAAQALLCPFDPMVWRRERTESLFDFHYRIEIYVPEPKRVHGYYVYPFLLDDALVARVDLKADRAAGVLRVPGAFAEPGADVGRVVVALAAELTAMAEWLGLSGVEVGAKGDLAGPLAKVVR